ncbi:MAG: hypothetical protein IKG56_01475 [Clostridia bacterium]|nr:hypothetical protein [Clostridia bacterium]
MKIIETYKKQTEVINLTYGIAKKVFKEKNIDSYYVSVYNTQVDLIGSTLLYIKHTKKISFFIGTLLTNLDIRNWITALKIKKIIKNQ